MKKITTLLSILICIVFLSCEREFENPYDRDCLPEIWSPENLVADTIDDGVLVSWEQITEHFDFVILERSTDGKVWQRVTENLIENSQKQFIDGAFLYGKAVTYRIFGIADKNTSDTIYSNYLDLSNVSCNCEKKYKTFTDTRDNHIYKTIKIGTQTWMAENLAYLPSVDILILRHDDNIPRHYVLDYWGTSVSDAKSTLNYRTYGVLYNDPAAINACPVGWHLPSNAEWTTLIDYLIANGYNFDGTTTGNKIAKSLSATYGWFPSSVTGTPGNDPLSNNSSCFSALSGGSTAGDFSSGGYHGSWWSSSFWHLDLNWYNSFFPNSGGEIVGYQYCSSIRCIKD